MAIYHHKISRSRDCPISILGNILPGRRLLILKLAAGTRTRILKVKPSFPVACPLHSLKEAWDLSQTRKKITFHHLILQVFSSSVNPVKYIHPAAFRGLLVLEYLILKNTLLLQLPSLQHIGHSLTTLEVRSSMHFNVNDAQEFTYLMKIKHIFMNDNGLRSAPWGLNLIANTIKKLDFASNAISSLASMEGVKFDTLERLNLRHNNITHLHPEVLFTPHLQSLQLEGNQLVSLGDVTQYSWGSLLSRHTYMAIYLGQNPWHCNGSLIWMSSKLFKVRNIIIYAKPPSKPYIKFVSQLLCESPDSRCGTTVVPIDVIKSVNISIRSLRNLAGKYDCHFS